MTLLILLTALAGCSPTRVDLDQLEGSSVRVVLRTQTEHSSNETLVDVIIDDVDHANGHVTLIEDGFTYPVPLDSIIKVIRDGKIVFSTEE